MKWAIVILLVLGVLAAGSAALLFNWVQVKNLKPASQAAVVDVLLAQADLPARTRVLAEHVKMERVPKAGLPEGWFTNQAQAVGKTLKVAVVKGQPLTGTCFLPETAIDDLLRPGMLAFQISLTRRATPVDLLYPGCIVDVFATFPLHDRAKGEAVVIPLLQNIQILQVRDQTVVTSTHNNKKESGGPAILNSNSGNVTVALEVNARQVAALQLVIEKGSLGLAMRNPLDKTPNPVEPMVMKEGQLTAASEAMDPQTLALVDQLQQLLGNKPPADANCPPTARPVAKAPDPNTLAPLPESIDSLSSKRSAWQMTIIRGQKVEEKEVKATENEGEEAPPAAIEEKPGTE